MRSFSSGLLATAVLCALSAAPAIAQPPDRGSTPGLGWGKGGSHGAPGPVAAAGLPFLLVLGAVGAYKAVRRRREESRREHDGSGEQG